MSSFRVIAAASAELAKVLSANLGAPVEPAQPLVTTDRDKWLSLWLYQITENEFVKNQPLARMNGGSADRFVARQPALALNLYYLLTPMTSNDQEGQVMLGQAMQTLYENAILPLRARGSRPQPTTPLEELRISLCRLDLEELTRIWDALREAYRLSVCYQVRVVTIDRTSPDSYARVVAQETGFEESSGSAAEGDS